MDGLPTEGPFPFLVWNNLLTGGVLFRGEKTAQVLESNLTNLEKKIDDLLASFEDSERRMVDEANGKRTEGGGKEGDGKA